MSKLYIVYIGTQKAANGEAIDELERQLAVSSIKRMFAAEFGGYSVEPVAGGYRYADGSTIEEQALRFEIVVPHELDSKVRPAVGKARDMLRQESVLVTSQQIASEFV